MSLSGNEKVISVEEDFNNRVESRIQSVDVGQPPSPATPPIAQCQGQRSCAGLTLSEGGAKASSPL